MEESNTAKKYLGRGWSFPPAFSKTAGTVEMSSGVEDINQSLHILLSTKLGDRVMLPDYGSSVEELLFEPADTTLQTLIRDRVETAILFYEPRIELERVRLETDQIAEGVLRLVVDYAVRATNSRFNFVYPFYITEGSDAAALQP